jgi:hypothetical protein
MFVDNNHSDSLYQYFLKEFGSLCVVLGVWYYIVYTCMYRVFDTNETKSIRTYLYFFRCCSKQRTEPSLLLGVEGSLHRIQINCIRKELHPSIHPSTSLSCFHDRMYGHDMNQVCVGFISFYPIDLMCTGMNNNIVGDLCVELVGGYCGLGGLWWW